METTSFYKQVNPPYQQEDELDPEWREALSRALRRHGFDREREKFQDWERWQNPPRHQQN